MTRQPQNQAFAQTSFLNGVNAAYIEEMQVQYEANPGSVSDEWRLFFQSLREEQTRLYPAVTSRPSIVTYRGFLFGKMFAKGIRARFFSIGLRWRIAT